MYNYLVYMPGGKEELEEQFPRACYRLTDGLWAVGSPFRTPTEVCEQLGVNEGDGRTMVVVSMEEYYGRYDRALWQKLNAWSAQK